MSSQKNHSVFVSGIFNVLHPGHLRFLDFARRQGDRLFVGVISNAGVDEKSISIEERLRNIKSISYVDEAFAVTGSPAEDIVRLRPDIVVKGWEFRDVENEEFSAIQSYGGRLIFSPDQSRSSGFSEFSQGGGLASGAISLPHGFMERRDFGPHDLKEALSGFSKLKVCVVGDIIIDNYISCSAIGMSREDPTIVIRPEKSTKFVGGAAVVASHASSLGAHVSFLSVSGDDGLREFSEKILIERGIDCHIFADDSRPTTEKTRYRCSGKTMLRVNNFGEHSIAKEFQHKILSKFSQICNDVDVVIFSDFSYGVLPQELVEEMIGEAVSRDVMMVADSQTSSQVGNLGKFSNVHLVTPTEHEARITVNDFESGLVALSNKIRSRMNVENVVVTLGEDGLLITKSVGHPSDGEFENDRLAAFQSLPKDPSGAGDAFLSVSSLALAGGHSIWLAGCLGALASAIQVSREGNMPIESREILEILMK